MWNTLRFPSSSKVRSLACGLVSLLCLASSAQAQTAPIEAPPPDNDRSPYHVALLDYKAGHFQEALDALTQHGPQGGPLQDERSIILESQILTELQRYDEGEKRLKAILTPTGPLEVQVALGNLYLRKRNFNAASKMYDLALQAKPGDPDLLLMMVYTRVGASDLVTAAKIASQLKPLDPEHPSYYFAVAAIAQATDKSSEADNDIETARTMYGITVVDHYLKTYLQVLSAPGKSAMMTPAASTNAAPATSAPSAKP